MAGDQDWVFLEQTSSSTLRAILTAQSSDTLVASLYDAALTYLGSRTTQNGSLIWDLIVPGGTYYLKIEEQGNNATVYSYTLRIF